MARLIEAQQVQALPGRLTMEVGDLLLVGATGARLLSGSDVVEVLGPAVSSVLAEDGSILSPAGPPNTVLLRALRPGDATVEILGGDPWQGAHSKTVEIAVTG
jgi:hypothetical protein